MIMLFRASLGTIAALPAASQLPRCLDPNQGQA